MIKPIGNRAVIEVLQQEETTASGIVLPDKAKDKPTQGKVIAVGKGKLHNGKYLPLEVTEGDVILFNKYAGTEVKWNGKKYLILQDSDILAVLDEQSVENQSAKKELVSHG